MVRAVTPFNLYGYRAPSDIYGCRAGNTVVCKFRTFHVGYCSTNCVECSSHLLCPPRWRRWHTTCRNVVSLHIVLVRPFPPKKKPEKLLVKKVLPLPTTFLYKSAGHLSLGTLVASEHFQHFGHLSFPTISISTGGFGRDEGEFRSSLPSNSISRRHSFVIW